MARRLSSFVLRRSLFISLRKTSILGWVFFLNPSERMRSTSRMYLSRSSARLSSWSTTRIRASFAGEEMTTVCAPAFLCRQLSFPSRSTSNPWTSCFTVAIRYPRLVSSGTSFSIRVVFPLSDFPTIEIMGIIYQTSQWIRKSQIVRRQTIYLLCLSPCAYRLTPYVLHRELKVLIEQLNLHFLSSLHRL